VYSGAWLFSNSAKPTKFPFTSVYEQFSKALLTVLAVDSQNKHLLSTCLVSGSGTRRTKAMMVPVLRKLTVYWRTNTFVFIFGKGRQWALYLCKVFLT
jgi:hypothetical protein